MSSIKFINKSFAVLGNWYAPLNDMIHNYRSIKGGEYTNTSNSSGDWEGFIVQKIGRRYHGIPFSQTNLNYYPSGMFSVDTGEIYASCDSYDDCVKAMRVIMCAG